MGGDCAHQRTHRYPISMTHHHPHPLLSSPIPCNPCPEATERFGDKRPAMLPHTTTRSRQHSECEHGRLSCRYSRQSAHLAMSGPPPTLQSSPIEPYHESAAALFSLQEHESHHRSQHGGDERGIHADGTGGQSGYLGRTRLPRERPGVDCRSRTDGQEAGRSTGRADACDGRVALRCASMRCLPRLPAIPGLWNAHSERLPPMHSAQRPAPPATTLQSP